MMDEGIKVGKVSSFLKNINGRMVHNGAYWISYLDSIFLLFDFLKFVDEILDLEAITDNNMGLVYIMFLFN